MFLFNTTAKREMACNGNGLDGLDGIRPASEKDFDRFRGLVDKNDGWTKQYDKRGVQVYTKSQEGTAIKMIKVIFVISSCCYT